MEQCLKEREENMKNFKLDPRTKLFIMILISSAEFLYSDIAVMVAIAFIPFVLLLTNKQIKTAVIYIVLFFVALCAKESQNIIQYNMTVNIIVVFLVGVVLRLFPAFAMGEYIINTTKASEFISAMSRLHISKKILIPVSVVFRFIPTMKEEFQSINDAMRMREIHFGSIKNPLMLVEYRLVPLMISVVKIGDDLSAAALCKGLDSPNKRSCFTEIKFSINDMLATIIIAVVLIITLSI